MEKTRFRETRILATPSTGRWTSASLPSLDLLTFAEHCTLRNLAVGAALVIANLKPASLNGFLG